MYTFATKPIIGEKNNIDIANPQWKKAHEDLMVFFQNTLDEYQEEKIDFHEYKSRLVGSSNGLEYHINFKHPLYNVIDTWMELLEFCYFEKDWRPYALEAGIFIIKGLKAFPEEVLLPEDSDFVATQMSKYTK